MQTFSIIAQNWLSAIGAREMDVAFQAIEANNSDSLAAHVQSMAAEAGVRVFTIEYQPNMLCDPMELFYQIARWYGETFGDEAVEQLIDECCYALHTRVMKAWYRREYYFREQPLLFDEAGYEELEFFYAIERLLDRFSLKQPFIVLINQIDWAPEILLTALSRLLQGTNVHRSWGAVGFIRLARRARRVKNAQGWQDCLRQLERQELIVPIHLSSEKTASFDWFRPATIKNFREQYRMMISAADTFAFQDVIQMAHQLRDKYSDQQAGQILFLSAFSSLMLGDLDSAVRNYARVQNYLQSTNNEGILTGSYYWQSVCYTLKTQEKFAREAQEQCEKLALDYSDQRWYALSQFAAYYIDAHLAQHQLTQSHLSSLRHLLYGLNYHNLLALSYTQVYNQNEGDSPVSPKTYLKQCVMALRIARSNRNMLGVSIALHAMGVVYMRIGNFRQTERLYQLSLNIREKYQSKADLVPMLNALGYFLIGQEEWQKAWSTFDRALSMLIENRNFNEASVTLYNFVWLYLQSADIQMALDMMNDLLELMRIREVDKVPFRNLKDLYTLKGWLHILLRQPIQARYCLVRVQNLKHLHETAVTETLRKLVSARLALADGEPDQALRITKKALKTIGYDTDLDLYMVTTLRLEIAHLFMDLGHTDRAAPIFAELRKKANALGLESLLQRISRVSLGIGDLNKVNLPPIAQPYHVLMEVAQKETQLLAVQNELSQYHQVNLLVEMSAETESLEAFLEQVIDVLDRRIPANDFAILLQNSESEGSPVELFPSNDVEPERIAKWRDRLLSTPTRDHSFQLDDDKCLALPLHVAAVEHGWLIICGDSTQKQVWNLTFLHFLAQQLGLILDRRLREAFLEHRNKTDLLTGVLNRAGLFERLKKQFAQLKRQPQQPFALCYFDLDHFKYFNDHFGHELGDSVLKTLVRSVGEQLRGRDEFGRLGGDEFIILLPDTDRSAADALMERLRRTLASPDWWLPLLVEHPETDRNPVPRDEWISASFGVVVVEAWPKQGISRINLIAQGDKAMYQAKNKGKNCVVVNDYSPVDER